MSTINKVQRAINDEYRAENKVLLALQKALDKSGAKPLKLTVGGTKFDYNRTHTARIDYVDVVNARNVEKKVFAYIKEEYDKYYRQSGINEGNIRAESRRLANRVSKLDIDIQRKVLDRVYSDLYKETERGLLEKFNKIDLNGEDPEFKKLIKGTDELIYDIKKIKAWKEQVEKLVRRAELEYKTKTKEIAQGKYSLDRFNKEYILSEAELEMIAEAILGRAIELCPIRTGFLRSSGKVYINDRYARIIFEAPYAAYVHDSVGLNHPIGQDHFLEAAAQEILPKISVWTEQTGDNQYVQYDWDETNQKIYNQTVKETLVNAASLLYWNENTGYQAVYIDIDRNLRINYYHSS